MLDVDEVRKVIADLKRKPRRHANWFEWLDKQGKELGIAQEFVVALERVAGPVAEHVKLGDDPPDIAISLQNGGQISLEITELVNQEAIEAQLSGSADYSRQIFDWDDQKIVSRITKRVREKEMKCRAMASGDSKLALLLHTDEPILSEKDVQEAIQKLGPIESDVFNEIWLIFSYDPKTSSFPLIRLDKQIRRDDKSDT
ncbi:MAG: hypothetical protein R3358_08200 [Woeseiaceae bacterium]|nr:hypothetical protein [Woeseiaceae bacterium]